MRKVRLLLCDSETFVCLLCFVPATDSPAYAVVGILDIAKCLYDAISKIEHAYELSPDRLSEAVKKVRMSLARLWRCQ